jgi:hypothetical protein
MSDVLVRLAEGCSMPKRTPNRSASILPLNLSKGLPEPRRFRDFNRGCNRQLNPQASSPFPGLPTNSCAFNRYQTLDNPANLGHERQ